MCVCVLFKAGSFHPQGDASPNEVVGRESDATFHPVISARLVPKDRRVYKSIAWLQLKSRRRDDSQTYGPTGRPARNANET